MSDAELIAAAAAVVRRRLSHKVEIGQVGAAVRGASGTIYPGVCIDAPCGVGFCAEHAAIAAMVTAGETRILAAVALDEAGGVLPPCGRCREFMMLLDTGNAEARILLPGGRAAPLAELCPEHWLAVYRNSR
ncbi:cytidine deaminase [Paralimibaculum aggregatum]|uniref:Cytidine deaminase n=1 Tax=Paralimibaculum aggregatum TaxID=3036245 RepID=A0ABQ6LTP1_9RHOB|nr:cytidine deaminase [Limibaculum sp. NKW23]GMG85438.1 cytidine deaminase [Limibaculum sp. NKW23]